MSADTEVPAPETGSSPSRRKPSPAIIAAVVVVLLAVAAGVYVLVDRGSDGDGGTGATGGTGGDGWETVWQETFDGEDGDLPDRDVWRLGTGIAYPGGEYQWGTGEIQTYTADPENVGLDGDGHLKITATRDEAGHWRSARLETARDDFAADAGQILRVEARIQVPDGGQGYWGAFWMLGAPFRPTNTNWPSSGEIDVMEFKGGEPSNVYSTFHCGVAPGGPCNENSGIGGNTSADEPLTEGFHTYGIELDRSSSPEEIRWYLDGEEYFTIQASQVDADTWSKATHHGFFILTNLAIGGAFGGPPDATTRPGASMLVDEISVSRR